MAKKVKKKLNFKKLLILLLMIYLLCYCGYNFFTRPIKNIIITGNTLVSDAEIISLAGIKKYPALFTLQKSKMINGIKKNKLISDVQIKRNLKYEIKINVNELKVVCLYLSTGELLLSDGTRIPDENKYEGIPTLINYTPDDVLKDFLNGLGKLDYGTISGISEIKYDPTSSTTGEDIDKTRFLLLMNDGNQVYINNAKIRLLSSYQKIYSSLKDKKGILHLDSGEYLEVK